jgi:glycosyltransferase involved in cell wall biosynthesis
VDLLYFADIRFPLERANGIQTMETCHALARAGSEITLIVRPDTARPARDPFAFYGLPPIDRLRIERPPIAGPALARRVGYLSFATGRAIGARADVLFTRDLGLASALVRIPRRLRPPLIYESHGVAPEVARALPELLATAARPSAAKLARLERREARVWRRAEGYVTITAGLAAELGERYGPRPHLAVIPDGTRVDADAMGCPPPEITARRAVAGYAGHLYAWKGADLLLEVLARLPEVEGLIVGGHEREPDLARLRRRADALGIVPRVRFTGLVPPAEVPAYLRRADVLVLPNPESAIATRFTSPLKLFEYMAACRPIVASDLPAIREILRDGDTALLARAGDPQSFAAAVRRLLDDRALAVRLADAARAHVLEFTWDRRAARIDALAREVAGARP